MYVELNIFVYAETKLRSFDLSAIRSRSIVVLYPVARNISRCFTVREIYDTLVVSMKGFPAIFYWQLYMILIKTTDREGLVYMDTRATSLHG